ncbi:MAG: ATP-binding protein [Cyclobacteriaceae bacterium]
MLHIGTQVSLQFKYTQGASDLYFPTALSLIMINWWGPTRVISSMYINAVLSTGLWGITNYYQWPLFAIPETLFTLSSWFLFTKVFKGEYWIPDVRSLANFIIWAMFVPIMIEISALESLLILFNQHPAEKFWTYFVRNSLGEFTSSFGLALPLLYYITPLLQREGLLENPPSELIRKHTVYRSTVKILELVLIFGSLGALTFIMPFQRFWFVYGLFSMYSALRFGFGLATITNYFIFLITYFIPKISHASGSWPDIGQENVINIFLGMLLLYVFAAITGRVISDLKKVEIKLQRRNNELGQTNSELDRFVYSVSHDLSAPLKSIRGLVNVSRIDKQLPTESYLGKIEASVQRLELFISEILDYSRNKRIWQKPELINIKELCIELIENLKFIDGFHRIKIDLDSLEGKTVFTDKSRLKIILNNLLSNAAKFQRKNSDEPPYIRVSCIPTAHRSLIIKVEDNGQGIRPELQNRIFEMFFRATDTEKGSGLGLYIAKEAAEKIGGRIWVHSEYGMGSIFQLEIPQIPRN